MPDAALSLAIKGWFVSCLTASAVLFLFGLATSAAKSLTDFTLGVLLIGMFLSVVHFVFIAMFTAAPAAMFIWIVNRIHCEYLVIFVAFGGALGWLAQLLFNPLNVPAIRLAFVVAGIAGGAAYWFVTEKRKLQAVAR
jgi:hypothetical protein